MRIGFSGGYGHHVLQGLFSGGASEGVVLAGLAGDGFDDATRKRFTAQPWWEPDALVAENLQQLLTEGRPDVVSVGSAYARHHLLTREVLEHGLPVVSEKPLADTVGHLHTLWELHQRTRLSILPEFTMRFIPAYQAAKDWILAGHLGEVILVQGQKSYKFGNERPPFYADRSLYGGTIPWVAIHAIDLVRFTTGLEFDRVSGHQGNVARKDFGTMEDHAVVSARMRNGAGCTITADYYRPEGAPTHGDDRLRITGTKGVLEVVGERATFMGENGEELVLVDGEHPDRPAMVREFLAVLQGANSVRIGTREGFRSTAVALAARDAADSGQVLTVAYPDEG